ncbi:MAG: carbohydrate binding family 9 domain-containing protein [Acidobacteria bacterium]|nr:carbohydrate binding family 9 domain-containing protein [Acidobacteriota bacterium]
MRKSKDSRKLRVQVVVPLAILLGLAGLSSASAQTNTGHRNEPPPQTAQLNIPRIDRPPQLEDFLEMRPNEEWQGKLVRLEGFVQRAPDYGRPTSERTEAYLGYDNQNLYVVFVAFDSQPEEIRARLGRREDVRRDEDQVGIYLDTFHDQRRAYQFGSNAVGIQYDSSYSEDTGVIDDSFDTVWYSRGRLTSQGFVVWLSIPFKSLRFPPTPSQSWGILLWRWLPRRSEGSWWPRATTQKRGQLGQTATATGLEGISPGRNLQFIPYLSGRAFRAPDLRTPAQPVYAARSMELSAGLDAKIILKDSLVLDLTVNPDFSQVESDEPQLVVNQRYEVFFPEKRPFFTENANYFQVPMVTSNAELLFTRRIADPQFGARLTGKLGALLDRCACGRR